MHYHAPTHSPVGIAQNSLTNHELVIMHIKVKALGNSVYTQLRGIVRDTTCSLQEV